MPFDCELTIAEVGFRLRSVQYVRVTPPFRPFLRPAERAWQVGLQPVANLPPVTGIRMYHGMEYTVWRQPGGGWVRIFTDAKKAGRPYALSRIDTARHRADVWYLSDAQEYFSELGNAFFHIGWEKMLAEQQRLILHASCVATPLGGLLFSGPSGIGKSTQAELWCRWGGGRLINGDRPVLGPVQTGWRAYGSPYAGSSHCHVDESCPIRAIVLLRQAPLCELRRLAPGEAFRRLYAGTTVYSWDAAFADAVCGMLAGLVARIPVYELACTPQREAVELLGATLKEASPL